jgi:membrane-associated phospholipid phosphatase
VASVVKPFGNGLITIPIYIGAALLGHMGDDTGFRGTLGEWGSDSFRALVVGAPPVLFFQYALGSSRPTDGDSDWRFFEGHASVSGHAFVGAVPFLTAAHLAKSPYAKGALYFGSTLCGLSRINDDAHYFSQAALGWWIAYLAASSVARTDREREERRLSVTPVPLPGGAGVVVSLRF